jgi:hypothetical protein
MSGAAKARKRDARFAPGKSGNLRGRPYGSQNQATILARELDRQIEVTIEDRRVRMSVREAIAMRVANGFARGELDYVRLVLEFDLVDRQEPFIFELSELEALL